MELRPMTPRCERGEYLFWEFRDWTQRVNCKESGCVRRLLAAVSTSQRISMPEPASSTLDVDRQLGFWTLNEAVSWRWSGFGFLQRPATESHWFAVYIDQACDRRALCCWECCPWNTLYTAATEPLDHGYSADHGSAMLRRWEFSPPAGRSSPRCRYPLSITMPHGELGHYGQQRIRCTRRGRVTVQEPLRHDPGDWGALLGQVNTTSHRFLPFSLCEFVDRRLSLGEDRANTTPTVLSMVRVPAPGSARSERLMIYFPCCPPRTLPHFWIHVLKSLSARENSPLTARGLGPPLQMQG